MWLKKKCEKERQWDGNRQRTKSTEINKVNALGPEKYVNMQRSICFDKSHRLIKATLGNFTCRQLQMAARYMSSFP